MRKIESVVFFSYFVIWLIATIALLITSKLIKDVKKKTKIDHFFGGLNAVAFFIAMNIIFHSWKTPVLFRLIFNLFGVIIAILSFKNVKYCQHCGVINQWVMFRKYCSKCGGLVESQSNK